MKRKHSHRPQSVHNKRDDVITARLKPIDSAIRPLCEVNYTIPKAWLDLLNLKKSDKKEPLVDEHENTSESVSSENIGLQVVIDDLRNELSETRTALDAVTLEKNQYKRTKELAECQLWDERDKKDDLLTRVKELETANFELAKKNMHLTAQNENLNKLINYDSDIVVSEATPSDSQSTYIVFNRTLLTDFLKTTDLDNVIAHILIPEDRTFAYVYDKLTSQLEERNVASYHDYYIIELPNTTEKQL